MLLVVAETARAIWDGQAETFGDEPDHGLRDVGVRRVWAEMLLPAARSSVLDVGCGTGSLSVLLAAAGHAVCGADLSGRMLRRARVKAETRGLVIGPVQGDAGRLPFSEESFRLDDAGGNGVDPSWTVHSVGWGPTPVAFPIARTAPDQLVERGGDEHGGISSPPLVRVWATCCRWSLGSPSPRTGRFAGSVAAGYGGPR
jgi:SAM-dependent methyltransferase